MREFNYKLPQYGLGTDFSKYERPISFAEQYQNRFRNITGGAERRPGVAASFGTISGSPNLTRCHEIINNVGDATLLASDDFGNIWKYNGSQSWTNVVSDKSDARMISVQAEDKLIFANGVDRNFYTKNGTAFYELKSIITKGKCASGTNKNTLIDGDISNWIGATLVANNDIVHNVTLDAYGIVTTVASASLSHTNIDFGANGAGGAARAPAAGDAYELIDYVDLNIIPIGATNGSDGLGNDNVAIGTSGTGTYQVSVSGINFANTEIRKGDIIYNTTRSSIDFVQTVSASISLQNGINSQVAGDSFAFFKSAMPIASNIHVHYGRVYYLDSRNQNRIVISAPDDPEDLTTYQKTLDSSSYGFSTQQPQGDVIKAMGSFQNYFCAAGKRNLFIYRGVTPISDTSTTDLDFVATAFYPNGIVSKFGVATNGNDFLHLTTEGLQSINISTESNTTIQNNASVAIRNAIKNQILQTSEDDLQITFYPRRTWTIVKVGSTCWILNANPSYNDAGILTPSTSWHTFSGTWANLNHYFVRNNGDLIGCGQQGYVYELDASAPTDAGTTIYTNLTTAWLTLEEPQKSVRIKNGQYIRPVFESASDISYTITANAGWDNYSSDTTVVSAGGDGSIGTSIVGTTPIGGGNFAQASKYPLRWRGEQVRLTFETESSAYPDVITGFTLYGNVGGRR